MVSASALTAWGRSAFSNAEGDYVSHELVAFGVTSAFAEPETMTGQSQCPAVGIAISLSPPVVRFRDRG